MNRILRNGSAGLALALGCVCAPGCYVDSDPPVGYADVSAAPVDVDVTPYVVYSGHPVYYTGGRWWYRDGSRWAYYRREPAELANRRPSRPERVERHEDRHEEHHEERR